MKYNKIDYKKRVFTAMNYISQNIDRDLSLEEVAEVASFSMFHFHRIFKAVVDETISEFTRRVRLELAANRLVTMPYENITDIAMNYGFSSSQNFARAFRQQFGMTASDYRKSKIGNIESKMGNELFFQSLYNTDSELMNLSDDERRIIVNAEVKEIPKHNVAYVRRIGPYDKENCQSAFQELIQWAAPRNYLGPKKILAIYWDNPNVTPSENCRFDACVILPDSIVSAGNLFTQIISGGLYAVCHFEAGPEYIQQAWEEAYIWLCKSGLECRDKPCYELYYNNASEHPEGKWIFDICIPLKH